MPRQKSKEQSDMLPHLYQTAKTSSLIRSLCDDVQKKGQEQGSASGCALMMRTSGRSAQSIHVTFLKTFFQTDVPVVMRLSRTFFFTIDEVQMKPRLIMTAFIGA